jgi:hypothetical protein
MSVSLGSLRRADTCAAAAAEMGAGGFSIVTAMGRSCAYPLPASSTTTEESFISRTGRTCEREGQDERKGRGRRDVSSIYSMVYQVSTSSV